MTLPALDDAMERLQEIPTNVISAKILSPCPRREDKRNQARRSSLSEWFQYKKVRFDVMPSEWSAGYNESEVYCPSPESGKWEKWLARDFTREVGGTGYSTNLISYRLKKISESQSAEATDLFDCWEQFRNKV